MILRPSNVLGRSPVTVGTAEGASRAPKKTGVCPMAPGAAAYQSVWVTIRILVVDDNDHFRRRVPELLWPQGLEIIAAVVDGDEALAAVVRACPDGVLLDINLPGRDGYVVAALLGSVCPSAKIVLTSSDTEDVSTEVLSKCGAIAFVPKTELATADLHRLFSGNRP
jgi:CheY-like chemotaxis protein